MKFHDFLNELSATGIEFWREGERLRYRVSEEALTPELLDQLKQHKQDILQVLRDGAPPVSLYPLSHGQHALWFVHQQAPESVGYNIGFTLRIRSTVDVAALKQAFQRMLERHAMLRATFPADAYGESIQIVHSAQTICFERHDVVGCAPDDVQTQVIAVHHQPFVLEHGPTWRVHLFTCAPNDHILLVVVHHIVIDGWSLSILLDELRLFYAAETSGIPAALPPLTHRYTDFVSLQNSFVQGERGETLWAYWQRQLSGELPVLNLPTDYARPPVQTYNGASCHFALSAESTSGLKELARQEGVTLYTLLLAAFLALLHRYTAQEDILVGSGTAGRNNVDFTGVVGYFVNPLVIRADLSGNPSFRAFLQQVRGTVLSAIQHQDYPFPLLVQRLEPEHDPSRSPLFQTAFLLQQPGRFKDEMALMAGRAGTHLHWGGLEVEPFRIPMGEGMFDLALEMEDLDTEILGTAKYNADLFQADTMARMMSHFQVVLDGIRHNPEQAVAGLPLLTEAERRRVLTEWNNPAIEFGVEDTVGQLFEACVARHPERIALVCQERQMRYSELNQRANQLAWYLRRSGVKPESIVGVCSERSMEMIIAILGILKAGGAYLPLDPAYPYDRLAFMLADAQPGIVLIQANLKDGLPDFAGTVIALDDPRNPFVHEPAENPNCLTRPEDLAYVIYTSGSTGQPKGVAVTHCGIPNLCREQIRMFDIRQDSRVLQFASPSFDASISEIFTTLLAGATLILEPKDALLPGDTLKSTLINQAISIVTLPPSSLAVMDAGDFPNLRTVVSAGEACTPEIVKQWQPQRRFINAYGPTETTVCATMNEHVETGSAPSIGPVIANTEAYIVDAHGQLVPVGVPGELYLGGIGLARGYLNRKQLTAEKFVPHLFRDTPGARLYKTGDLASYNVDGIINFLGRIDRQVKIRGFRVETGEIEATLTRHPAIQEALVIAAQTPSGDTRLVAYLIPVNRQHPPTTPDVRMFLKQTLPEYMIPAHFVFIPAFPLTPNGKIDHRALPSPDRSSSAPDQDYVAPRTPIERSIAEIWAEVLETEQVGIYANFFDIGGHSLLATQIVSRLRQRFHTELPLRDFLEHPTIADLAARLDQTQASQSFKEPIQPAPRAADMPLSFSQKQMWVLCQQLESRSMAYNMPGALRLTGKLNLPALECSLNEVIRRHEILRTTFPAKDGEPVQHVAQHWDVVLPVIDLRNLSPETQNAEAQRRLQADACRPFDLAVGPLFRASVLTLSDDAHIVGMTFHHIIFDGWSFSILVRELAALYDAFATGRPSPLPEPRLQYADFACWQRQQLQGEALESRLAYWLRILSGELPILNLPLDHPRPATPSFTGATHPLHCAPHLTTALKTLCQQEKATLFMALLAAFKILLYRYTYQDDLIVGVPAANRLTAELEALIGYFVNPVAFRTDLSGNPSARQVVRRVRETVMASQEYQDVPFEHVVSALHSEREWGRNPVFQVMFVWQNLPTSKLALRDLTLDLEIVHNHTAKFDLVLEMEETERGLSGTWEYNTALFEPATIQRISGHFERILETMIADPEQGIADIAMLTEVEQRQILFEWNDTAVELSREYAAHQIFEAQAGSHPDRIALVFQEQQMTYGELDQRANQVAHYLRQVGVGPEMLVGLCVERSFDLITALLGILKAGGAFLPIDPNYPEARRTFMLADAGLTVIVTQQRFADQFTQSSLPHVICLDTDRNAIAQQSRENPAVPVTMPQAAYVIYTSGSTGRPKGVVVTHRGVYNLCQAEMATFGLRADSRVLQFSSISFDAAVFEIFGIFAAGAAMYLAPQDELMPGEPLQNVLRRHAITLVTLPPSALNALDPAQLPDLRTIISAGEACSIDLVRAWSQGRHFVNAYGPTETTVCATMNAHVNPEQPWNIGEPIQNFQTYILDHALQPVPVGVPGELYLGGIGVARDYLNRPELTTERFIRSPFSSDPDTRLYKSGDLARYLPDGSIEFLGRIDHQIKIRGLRVELGEIEAAITQYPGVQDVVVMLREDRPGVKLLVAYVVFADSAGTPPIDALRNALTETLPGYMVPAVFMPLSAMPLTPNGKIDRRALPKPEQVNDNAYAPPTTPTEQALAQIWAEVLRLERVGIDQNFFELGGDSILSIQIISRAAQAGIHLTAAQLFQHQTIAELAAVAGTAQVVAAEQGTVTGSVALTPIQQWFFEQHFSNPHYWNQALLLRTPPDLNPKLLEQALQQLQRHHDSLRLRFAQDGETWQQTCLEPGLAVPFDIIDLPEVSDTDWEQVLEKHASTIQASLNISQGPMFRAAYFRNTPDQSGRLLLVSHHLVIDGVSWRILAQDLQALYHQLAQNEPIRLPAKTTSFQAWAARLVTYAQSGAISAEYAYWSALAQAPVAPLPVDYAIEGHERIEAANAHIVTALNEHETLSLLRDAQQAYNTQINDVLLTALLQAFAAWTGSDALLLNLEGHGREELFTDVDVSRTIGWFTSLFPVFLTLNGVTQPGEALKSIKEQLRQITNRGIGFGLLRYLRRDEALRAALQKLPAASVSFNYLGQFDQEQSEAALFALAGEATGPVHDPVNRQLHQIDIVGRIFENTLQIEWIYSHTEYRRETIAHLADAFLNCLRTLIAHCLSAEAGGYTPSDFPDVDLNQAQLDAIIKEISGVDTADHRPKVAAIYPLSPSQQGMLVETLMTEGSGIHIEQSSWNLSGDLNVNTFKQAWQQLLERHALLRTGFVWQHTEEPLQVALQHATIPIDMQDWRDLSESQRQAKLDEYLLAERRRGFELNRVPLMRLALFRTAGTQHICAWSFHHILLDGWCAPLLAKEFLERYDALSQHTSPDIPATTPYSAYIRWLQQQDLARAETFWRTTLRDMTRPTPLGKTGGARGALGEQERYAERSVTLPEPDHTALRALTAQHHVTLNSVVQGVWALLLSRYSADADVLFGATVSGRPADLAGIETMIGQFITTVPVRITAPPDALFWGWLQDVQAHAVTRNPYEYCSTGQIHQWSEFPGGLPLYESILVFENYPLDASAFTSTTLSLDLGSGRSIGAQTTYALTILIAPTPQLTMRMIYDARRFRSQDIERIAQHFLMTLHSVAADPEQPLAVLRDLIADNEIPLVGPPVTQTHRQPGDAGRPPTTPSEQQLAAIWAELLGAPPLGIEDNFFESGGHSLMATQFLSRIRTAFQLDLSLQDIFAEPTVGGLGQLIDTLRWAAHTPSIATKAAASDREEGEI